MRRKEQTPDGGFHPRDAYPATDRAFAEGWGDPQMDDYDRYDESKGPG